MSGSATTSEAADVARPRLAGAIWAIGTALLALITWMALGQLLGTIPSTDVGTVLASGAELVAAAAVAGVGLLAVILWARRPTTSPRAVLVAGLGLTAALRLAAIAWVHPELVSDWRHYHDLAVSIVQGGPWFADVPTGYPLMLAPLYALLGPNPILGEFLNVGLALWTAAMVHLVASHRFGRSAGAAAMFLFAIFPSQILMSTVLGTEVAYGAFVATALAVAVVGQGGSWRWTVALGVVLGLSQYVRPTSMFVLPAAIVLGWLSLRSARDAAVRGALLVTVFLIVMVPAVLGNIAAGAGPSITTSRYGGWSLLIGLNTQSVGGYNFEDIDLVGLTPGTVAWDRRASELAIERFRSNSLANVDLFVKKFPLFWGADDYGAGWTAVPPWNLDQPVGRAEVIASQVLYAGALLLALAGLAAGRRTWRHPTELWIVMVVATVALLHTFVEIQARYHAYVIPLLCVLAAGGVATGLRTGPRATITADGSTGERGARLSGGRAARIVHRCSSFVRASVRSPRWGS